ncbi:MAG TPA: DarT ssDNA thymidine ADP-ribosyltransferase family protein [Nakamurella sp.]
MIGALEPDSTALPAAPVTDTSIKDRRSMVEVAPLDAPGYPRATDVAVLPQFIDFELMTVRDWRNTQDDTDRIARRAAEVLVLGRVPIDLVSAVATSNEDTLSDARAILDTCSGRRVYRVVPSYLYGERRPQ